MQFPITNWFLDYWLTTLLSLYYTYVGIIPNKWYIYKLFRGEFSHKLGHKSKKLEVWQLGPPQDMPIPRGEGVKGLILD